MKPVVVAFELGHTQSSGLAGGDVILEHLSPVLTEHFDLHVVVPAFGARHWQGRPATVHALPESTPPERDSRSIWRRYRRRVHEAAALVERELSAAALLYSSTDVWPDVATAAALRRHGRTVSWIGRVHHLIPAPFGRQGNFLRNLGSHLLQRRSFRLLRGADLVIALNETLVDPLHKSGLSRGRIRVLGAGIPLDRIESTTTRPANRQFDAVFLGRLHRTKGVFDLVPIWRLVTRRHPDARLGIIGDGEERRALEATIRSAGLDDRITLLGFLSDEEKWRTLKAAKLFLAPDHEAGFGIAIAEAMACRLPIVGWDLPSFTRTYPEGFRSVPLMDHEAFATSVSALLTDDEERARLAEAAHRVAMTFDRRWVGRTLTDWFIEFALSAPRR